MNRHFYNTKEELKGWVIIKIHFCQNFFLTLATAKNPKFQKAIF